MKKVAFIITKSEVGGAQTWVRDQIRLFQDEIEPMIITNHQGWLSESLPDVKCIYVPQIESRFSITALLAIAKAIKSNKIDIVIASSANAGLYSRLAKVFVRFRCVYVSHGWSCLYNGGLMKVVFTRIEWLLSFLTDTIWCVSQRDYELAEKVLHIAPVRLSLARNAIFANPIMIDEDNNLQSNRDYLSLLAVGRLAHPKRFDLLIDAVKNIDNVKLTIVGDGPNRDQLHNYHSDKVYFLGEIKSFSDYQNYDAFILISDSEGLPMSALEAGINCLPMILSNVGGCHELIDTTNSNGILVSNTPVNIIEAIKKIISNQVEFKLNAKIKSDDFNIKKYKSLYKKIIFG